MSAAGFAYAGASLPMYASKDAAITQRPTSTAILAIDSEDRYATYNEQRGTIASTGSSPYSFTINKKESIMNGFFTRVGVTEVCFPWVIPNINRKTSSILVTYSVGGPLVGAQIDLATGFYTPSALASALQTAIRALNPGLAAFTMTYGINTDPSLGVSNLPVFEYATNNASIIAFAPLPPTPLRDIGPTTKQLFDVLGFGVGNTVPITGPETGGYTYAQATRYVDIVCTQLTNNQALKDTMSQEVARTVMCRLYLGDPSGSQSTVSPASSTFCPPGCAPFTIYRDYASPKQIAWLPNQPIGGYLKFDVYDDNGDLLEQSAAVGGLNHCDWSMTVLVTEN